MRKNFSRGVVVLAAAILLAAIAAQAESPAPTRTLYFLIHSGACPCQQEDCALAKPIAAFVQGHLAAGVEYKELDYGTRPETVEPLQRQYKIFVFPSFLALDANKKEVLKTQGKMKREEILKKLFEQGLITGVN
jgi:hypothetical protein